MPGLRLPLPNSFSEIESFFRKVRERGFSRRGVREVGTHRILEEKGDRTYRKWELIISTGIRMEMRFLLNFANRFGRCWGLSSSS